ncbi:MAG: TIGR01777 family oxidoreductase [Oligoflexia bacterium]|nr:TIGR01777 family oxidoreductase [Oligoflexia bacterium]
MIGPKRRIAISGSTGLIGQALIPFLRLHGYHVIKLIRGGSTLSEEDAFWNPQSGQIEAAKLEGIYALINLSGENIAAGRWSSARKTRIRESRVQSTALLSSTIAQLSQPPKVFISASAVGIYGDRGAQFVRESDPPGQGFLAEVGKAWEAAAQPAAAAGIRTILLRTGMVLSLQGGALKQMLLPFRLGLGGRFGSGSQYMSWIVLEDLLGIIKFALETADCAGALNAVAPEPVSNAEFTRILASALRRRALLPVPAVLLKIVLGEMAEELLLGSIRAIPERLRTLGFAFKHPELAPALATLLQKPA